MIVNAGDSTFAGHELQTVMIVMIPWKFIILRAGKANYRDRSEHVDLKYRRDSRFFIYAYAVRLNCVSLIIRNK